MCKFIHHSLFKVGHHRIILIPSISISIPSLFIHPFQYETEPYLQNITWKVNV